MPENHVVRPKLARISCVYSVDELFETVALEACRQADLYANATRRSLRVERERDDDRVRVKVEGPEQEIVATAAELVGIGHPPFALFVEDEEQYEALSFYGSPGRAYFHTITVGFTVGVSVGL